MSCPHCHDKGSTAVIVIDEGMVFFGNPLPPLQWEPCPICASKLDAEQPSIFVLGARECDRLLKILRARVEPGYWDLTMEDEQWVIDYTDGEPDFNPLQVKAPTLLEALRLAVGDDHHKWDI